MKTKILRNSTIVAPELYVERAADRQLRQVVNDMGRPPYILVARQMGKTNLLINMKRQRENDIVLYLDLSNRFESARLWFRNIIDLLIDVNFDVFDEFSSVIKQQREGNALEPSTEYDRHLRLLLRGTTKKVIIVLDEIDSLVGCSYSDVVLAQVRSMYFSRTNYEEYNRLTYVLSGVAEPSELIKNKDISPFNIGEKIYLEDFSRSEFAQLLDKLEVRFSFEVAERIFDWVGGNPRMTWDVCSEVENILLKGDKVDASVVDDIVYILYLRDFDVAPIDHIRTLVESDSQVRSAVVSVRYGNSNFPDDKIKSKLYLSGITTSAGGDLRIKNRVIDEALSDRWIEQVSSRQQSLLVLASEAFAAKNYEATITHFEDAVLDPEIAKEITPLMRLNWALSYQWTKKKDRALIEFDCCYNTTDDAALKQLAKFYLGVALLAAQSFPDSLEALQEAAQGPVWTTKANAQVNILLAYFKLGGVENITAALELSQKIIDELSQKPVSEAVTDYIVSALYNTALIYQSLGDHEIAENYLNKALESSAAKYKPGLLIAKYNLSGDVEAKKIVSRELVDVVLNGDIELSLVSEWGLGLNKHYLGLALCCVDIEDDLKIFDTLLRFIIARYYKGQLSAFNVLIDLFDKIKEADTSEGAGVPLLHRCAKTYLTESTLSLDKIKLFRALVVSTLAVKDDKHRLRYLEELELGCPADLIGEDDIQAFILVLYNFASGKGNKNFLYARSVWSKFEQSSAKKYPHWCTLVCFYEMTYYKGIGDRDAAEASAKKIVELVDNNNFPENQFTNVWPDLKRQAQSIIRPAPHLFKGIGRNDKVYVQYLGADPVIRKYKQVSKDLAEGKCVLINKA